MNSIKPEILFMTVCRDANLRHFSYLTAMDNTRMSTIAATQKTIHECQWMKGEIIQNITMIKTISAILSNISPFLLVHFIFRAT